jgi:hypothetical protein
MVAPLESPNLSTEQPKNQDFVDENGIRTTIEYTVNEDGKKVKVRLGDNSSGSLRIQARSPGGVNGRCKNPSWTTP